MLFVVAAVVYVQMKPSSPSDDTKVSAKKSVSSFKNNAVVPDMKKAAPPPVNDVWEERRKRGIAHATTVQKTDAKKEDKPFGSSYYYAHNSTKNKGGYSDGLRMEDFTMNGPRLLSKGGQADHEIVESEVEPPAESTSEAISKETPLAPSTTIISKNITRYLWDDPGDSKGIGSIRIDTLPGASSSSDDIDWKDANIQTVSATLEGKGLLVIATDENKKEYRLRIQTLYDTVSEVRTVVKTKRLLIKLHKQKSFGKANLNSWPHPQKKSL